MKAPEKVQQKCKWICGWEHLPSMIIPIPFLLHKEHSACCITSGNDPSYWYHFLASAKAPSCRRNRRAACSKPLYTFSESTRMAPAASQVLVLYGCKSCQPWAFLWKNWKTETKLMMTKTIKNLFGLSSFDLSSRSFDEKMGRLSEPQASSASFEAHLSRSRRTSASETLSKGSVWLLSSIKSNPQKIIQRLWFQRTSASIWVIYHIWVQMANIYLRHGPIGNSKSISWKKVSWHFMSLFFCRFGVQHSVLIRLLQRREGVVLASAFPGPFRTLKDSATCNMILCATNKPEVAGKKKQAHG